MNKISAVIITKNEEEIIDGCLRSLDWVDEIIIIDSNSTDSTYKIARRYTNRIFKEEWKGFVRQRESGIEKTKYDWILSIDADERVSLDLKKEIKKELSNNNAVLGYDIPFVNIFLGREMKYGGWRPEYHTRLFNKKFSIYDKYKIIHEEIEIEGKIKKMKYPIYHLSHRDIASNLLKTRSYAIIESEKIYKDKQKKVTRISLLQGVISHFIKRYIMAKGYKDGMEGFIEAMYQAFSQIFIIQSMLWERQRGRSSREIYKEIDKKIIEKKI
jgi:glycosyltransferase involved in cell wall biosynthesis